MGKSHSKQPNAEKASVKRNDKDVSGDVILAAREAVEFSPEDQLCSMVKMRLSASHLGRPGHFCIVAYERVGQEPWEAIGFTEVSPASDSPSFSKSLLTKYYFEKPQKIRLYLYRLGSDAPLEASEGSRGPDLPSDSVMVSSCDCVLAEAIAGVDGTLSLNLAPKGEMTLCVEEFQRKQTKLSFDLKIETLDVSLILKTKNRKPSIFVSMYRTVEESLGVPQHRTQVFRSEAKQFPVDKEGQIRDAEWKGVNVSTNYFSKSESSKPMTIELWVVGHHQGDDHQIGSAQITLEELDIASRGYEMKAIKVGFEKCKASMIISDIMIERNPSFLDYIASGLEISLFVAIDFTKSNKQPEVPGSLHHFDTPENPNDYAKAIRSVVDILQYYDSDKMIPVYGFGARLPPSYTHCSHCFACNGDYFNPEVAGIEAIIQTYRNALNSVVLHGPTNFHEIVRLVGDFSQPFADASAEKPRYSILLILTDGVITDMKQTINEVVRAADFPMSIVIVGVGEEDFGLMRMLDSDDQKLYSTEERRFAARDIVQFVPFEKLKDAPAHQLAVETLAEIPREVVGFFSKRNVHPKSQRGSGVSSQMEFSLSQKSEFVKQLEKSKGEFINNFIKNYPEMDEFEAYKILNEDKTPAIDLAYFSDLVQKAPRGTNVFSMPRPSTPDSNKKGPSRPFAASGLAKAALPGSTDSKSQQSPSFMKRAKMGGSPTKSVILLDFNDSEAPVGKSPSVSPAKYAEKLISPVGSRVNKMGLPFESILEDPIESTVPEDAKESLDGGIVDNGEADVVPLEQAPSTGKKPVMMMSMALDDSVTDEQPNNRISSDFE